MERETGDFFELEVHRYVFKFLLQTGLCIQKKTQINKIDALKEIIRAYGMNPEQILTQKALADGATIYECSEDYENEQLRVLREELKQLIQQAATGEKSK